MIDEESLDVLAGELREELDKNAPELLREFSVETYLQAIRNYPTLENYFGLDARCVGVAA